MQARCPHCTQVFTAEYPGRQFCPACGQQVDVPAPGEAAPEPGAAAPLSPAVAESSGSPRTATPWERRRELGLARGFFEQWKETMLRPQGFWARVRPHGPWSDALLYGWLISLVAGLLGLPVQLLGGERSDGTLETLRSMLREHPALLAQAEAYFGDAGAGGRVALGALLANVVFYPVGTFAIAAFLHLACLLFGAARNGFWATFRAVAYGSAPFLLGFVPCLGVLAMVYACVQLILGVQNLQETSGGRAAGAVLTPMAFFACCTCASVAAIAAALGLGGAR